MKIPNMTLAFNNSAYVLQTHNYILHLVSRNVLLAHNDYPCC
jgi:hypothetical protein